MTRNRTLSIAYGCLFVLILMIGNYAIPPKQCPVNYGLDGPICVPCLDESCVDCSTRYDRCDTCMLGSYSNQTSQCQPCDPFGFCESCNVAGVCTSCMSGFRLDSDINMCKACEDSEGCAVCDYSKCLTCKPGFFLDEKGTCQKCTKYMRHCTACSDKDTCLTC